MSIVGTLRMKITADTSHVLDPLPRRANRAARRACAKTGHEWKRFGDGSVRCFECGEDK